MSNKASARGPEKLHSMACRDLKHNLRCRWLRRSLLRQLQAPRWLRKSLKIPFDSQAWLHQHKKASRLRPHPIRVRNPRSKKHSRSSRSASVLVAAGHLKFPLQHVERHAAFFMHVERRLAPGPHLRLKQRKSALCCRRGDQEADEPAWVRPCVVDLPTRAGKPSAVFVHLASSLSSTRGCLARQHGQQNQLARPEHQPLPSNESSPWDEVAASSRENAHPFGRKKPAFVCLRSHHDEGGQACSTHRNGPEPPRLLCTSSASSARPRLRPPLPSAPACKPMLRPQQIPGRSPITTRGAIVFPVVTRGKIQPSAGR